MDFAIAIDNQTGLVQMTYDQTSTLMNNIYLSLMVRRGSFFADPEFGSRLHLLQRAKDTAQTAQRAVGYAKEALQWMIDTGKAKSVEVYAQRERQTVTRRLYLLIEVIPVNSDQPVAFSTFIEVI